MPEQPKELSPEKLRLLQRRLQGAAGKPAQESVIPPRKRADASHSPEKVLLSFAEEGLWLVDQLDPNSALYSIPFGLRLKGVLDVTALQRCLNEILQRHEALRTRFESEEGHPVQVIYPVIAVEMPLEDLSATPEAQREKEALRICQAEARRPFDLKRDILFRARLIRLGATEHLLFLNVHHIVADGWSVNLLLRELTGLYEAFANSKPSPLPPLPVQYADFSVWQRNWLQGETLDKQLDYWRKQLEGSPALLELPADRPRPATPSHRGAQVIQDLPQALADGLADFTKQEGVTLFITLMAAFQSLLQRYTGQTDVPVGTPMAGRNWKEIEGLVGYFVNTLVIRGDLSDDPSFRTLVNRIKKTSFEAYTNQDVPFEMLVKELQPKRDISYAPFFQTMLVFLELPSGPTQSAGLEVSTMILDSGTSKFDLTLSIRKRGEALQAIIEYSTDLFDEETIERMLGHYQKLLEGIVSHPDEKLSRLPLLTEEEKRRILVEWNRTEVEYPRKNLCVHELFQEQVERTPDAIALVFEEKKLTYRELNARANQLARHLRTLGIGADSLVGICMDRSPEMIIAALGVLKAGGAYAPLDPEYPKDRLAFMLEDSGVTVLLTQVHLVGTLPPAKAKLIRVDADWPLIANENSANVENVTGSENLAYMIFTSGSTGRPKGALNTHRGIVNRLLWMQDVYPLKPSDKVLQKTPFSFDVSVSELLGPLIAGAALVVARPGGQRDPAYLAQTISREKVTVMHFVPSLLQMLLQQEGVKESCSSLRLAFCGGEIMSPKLQEQFFASLGAKLTNLYGPAEAAVDSTYWLCKRNSPLKTVPIGRPVANVKTYILDEHLQPVPAGVAGELHISGAGLARGYHNRPELTASKFIANPFSADPTSRLYKTGDLVRYLPDGTIDFLGRVDHQVKIRGFRVELGEVEQVLNRHHGVQNSVAIVREDTPGDKRLIAYWVSKNGPISQSDLREFLRARLPDFMVPAAFVPMRTLPLNPNGKVDRKALPKPDFDLPADQFVPPGTPTEIILAGIWREVLGVKRINIQDNFFETGGHSLLAVQLISKINKALSVNVPIPVFFQNPSVKTLAAVMDRENLGKRESKLIQLQSGRSAGALYLLDISIGLCRLANHLEDIGPAIYGTVVPLDYETFQSASRNETDKLPGLRELAAAHTALIQSCQPSGPCYLAGHSFGGLLAFEVAHQLQRAGRQVEIVFLLDSWAETPSWWKKLRVMTWSRARETLKYRTGRLWSKLQAKMSRLVRSPSASGQAPISSSDINLPMGDAPWGIWEKIYHHARKGHQLRQLESRAILFRTQDSDMSRFYPVHKDFGCVGLFRHGLNIVETPGDHFTLLKDPQALTLAERFKECLKEHSVSPNIRTQGNDQTPMTSTRK